jgi:hypothetical protein
MTGASRGRRWPAKRILAGGALALVCAAWPQDASAQNASTQRASDVQGRIEISGGVGWTGGSALGTATAALTGNGVPTGSPVTLFEVDTRIDGGPRIDGRVAWRLTRTLAIEGGVAVTRTHVRTAVSQDVEQAPPLDVTERFTEYVIDAGVVLQIPRLAFAGGRAQPFVTGGAGYLRQLHEGATLIDTGQSAFAGGGLTYVLRQAKGRAFIETIGLRGDVRMHVRIGGFEIEGESGNRVLPAVSGGLFVRF